MRRFAPIMMVLLLALPLAGCGAGTPSSGAAVELKTEDEKTLYALGVMVGGNLGPLHLSPAELKVVSLGVNDAASGTKPQVDLQVYGPKVRELAQARAEAGAATEKKNAQAFQDSAAAETGAVKTASGMVIRTLKPGSGPSPTTTDVVRVHYQGSLTDGTVFDSSLKRGQPAEFPLNRVIPCWTEALQRMKVGEKAKLVCPSDIAYGNQGRPPTIPGGATLVFEVELLEIKK